MAPLPRARCPACGRVVPVRVTGQLREHLTEAAEMCMAAGMHLGEARAVLGAGKKFRREMAKQGMRVEGTRTNADGIPEITIHVGDEKEENMGKDQLRFEGLDIRGQRFQLKGTTDLATKKEVAIGDVVSGEFKGTVTGVHFDQKDGQLVRKHVVEVDDGSID